MQIPILSGIYSDDNGDYRTAYPQNMIPVPKAQGVSNGYLRPSYGVDEFVTGPGVDRGGIEWNGAGYRVMHNELVRIDTDGNLVSIGTLEPLSGGGTGSSKPFNLSGYVHMTHSFDTLAIASAEKLFLYSPFGAGLREVTDVDLRAVLDVVYLDGYFVTTDGEYLVTGTLGDPDTIPTLAYQSSELDPDPIVGLLTLRNEVVALNRYTIEFFDNVGGDGISTPLRRIDGAQIDKGLFGRNAKCVFNKQIAFLGSAENEQNAVYLGNAGGATKISTREIDMIIEDSINDWIATGSGLSVVELIKLEAFFQDNHETLMVHLPRKTICYDLNASKAMQRPVWYELFLGTHESPSTPFSSIIRVGQKFVVAQRDSDKLGYLTDSHSKIFGESIEWCFQTSILYNEGNGFTVHEVKLQGLTGRAEIGADPIIYTQFSNDSGDTWSTPKSKKAGVNGKVKKRIEWARQGDTDEVRIQRFYGTSDAHLTIARLDMQLEPSAL